MKFDHAKSYFLFSAMLIHISVDEQTVLFYRTRHPDYSVIVIYFQIHQLLINVSSL